VFAPPAESSQSITPAGASQFTDALQRLIDAVAESGATPIISTQLMASGCDCEGLDGFLGETTAQIEANRQVGRWITAQIRQVAADKGLLLIDCADALPCNQEMLGDAIHLTAQGHQAVAETWARALEPRLELEPSTAASATEQRIAP
jgi:lysophospholipase L1-like esterase